MEYPSNSNKQKTEQKQQQSEVPEKRKAVVKATVRKKTGIARFVDSLISKDIKDMKTYLMDEVVKPTIRNTISDSIGGVLNIVQDSINTALYGETGARVNRKRSSNPSYMVPYDRISTRTNNRNSNVDDPFHLDDLVFTSRGDAELVLRDMQEDIRRFGSVTVLTLFDLADQDAPYTGRKYGWKNLNGVRVRSVHDGYVIDLPRPVLLD